MSKERGQQNRDIFTSWLEKMRTKASPNWLDYWHGNTLSPKKIADELGFDSSAFKKSRNEKLFKMLESLKQELAIDGIHHEHKSRFSKDGDVIEVKAVNDEDIKDNAEVRDLKAVNRRLQTENAQLAAELIKLSEFKEVIIEMGLWK